MLNRIKQAVRRTAPPAPEPSELTVWTAKHFRRYDPRVTTRRECDLLPGIYVLANDGARKAPDARYGNDQYWVMRWDGQDPSDLKVFHVHPDDLVPLD